MINTQIQIADIFHPKKKKSYNRYLQIALSIEIWFCYYLVDMYIYIISSIHKR